MVVDQIAVLTAAALGLIAALAEFLHGRRCRALARLAFGPTERPSTWVRAVPALKVLAVFALTWGLVTLMTIVPKVHQAESLPDDQRRHLLLVLDVSPSMRLVDAGPDRKRSRTARVADLMESFFQRVPPDQFLVTVVACYNGAKPVVQDTKDMEIVRNILNDLPMQYAFPSGKTDLFSGLEEAARIGKTWPPRSATLMLVSDGDSVPAKGMPTLPASIRDVVMVGVGDARTGTFIDGRMSRQDASTLSQMAARLHGLYHNGNEKHLPSDMLARIAFVTQPGAFERLTRREYALLACVLGSTVLAALPWLLHVAGTAWRPGVNPSRWARPANRDGNPRRLGTLAATNGHDRR